VKYADFPAQFGGQCINLTQILCDRRPSFFGNIQKHIYNERIELATRTLPDNLAC